MELSKLPGTTRLYPGPAENIIPSTVLQTVVPLYQRPVIMIATASISDQNIYSNGLYQNCFLIYRLMEAIGWMPILIVNKKPTSLEGIPEFIRSCRIAETEDIMKQPIPAKVYLEVGMSLSGNLRRFFKLLGAKTVKLYLGNILNIDIEQPAFLSGMNFSHHIVGEQDEIWTSPHYFQHAEYAACINKVEPVLGSSMRIAPYVWDPCVITDDGKRTLSWKPWSREEGPTFLIMEPNISFQKHALVPILIVEEWYRANPGTNCRVIVCNGPRFLATGYFKHTVEPQLSLAKDKRIEYIDRNSMLQIMEKYPSCIPVCHQFVNDFNYMVLEFLWAGFPVIHNSESWKDIGYAYPENSIRDGVRVLQDAITGHHDRVELYKSHARALAWRHSVYNPDVQTAWKTLVAH